MHKNQLPIGKSSLYVVATPIRNLGDITERAIHVLSSVDVVAAEDTRVTGQLLKHYGINTPLVSVREHNERAMADKLIARLAAGESIAQVSDAGTPAVSDPGATLAAAVHAAGYPVVPIPGASALTVALSASGFNHPHHLFYGFLPPKSKQRQDALAALAQQPYLLVFYEAPHRIAESVRDMANLFGVDRVAVLARELTKTFETIRRAPLGELADWIAQDSNQQRGEAVIIVDAAPEAEKQADGENDALLLTLLEELPLKQAVHLAQKICQAPRNDLYQRALELKKSMENE